MVNDLGYNCISSGWHVALTITHPGDILRVAVSSGITCHPNDIISCICRIIMRYYFGWCHPDYLRQHRVKSTSSTSSSTSPYLQYSGGVSLYAWCRYSWVFMLLKCGAGVTTRQVWSESSHGVTRPMISKNWTDFILKWTGLYTLELTTHWPQSWLCGNTLVVMTHTKFPLSPFDQEYNLIKPDPVCITHQ